MQHIKEHLEQILTEADIYIKNPLGDGLHFHALVVSTAFEGLPLVARHRMVMNPLKQHFKEDVIHALSLKALTPQEFEQKKDSLKKYLT